MLLVLLCILVPAGVGYHLASPWIGEAVFHMNCTANDNSERCHERMRTIGHRFSAKGRMEDAFFWYAIGAERGDPKAMFHLAWMYERRAYREVLGRSRPVVSGTDRLPDIAKATRGSKDAEMARQWYAKSAKKGYAPSMNNLGQLYFVGLGGRKDPNRTFKWCLAAAKAGNPVARLNVANAYASGIGVRANPMLAGTWMFRAVLDKSRPDMAEPTLTRTRLNGREMDRRARAGLPEFVTGNGLMGAIAQHKLQGDMKQKLLERQKMLESLFR